MGEGVLCQRFAGAAEAAGYPVPHMGSGLIRKYVADLKHLGLIA